MDQHPRQVERGFLTAFFSPETQQALLVFVRDYSGVGTSNEFPSRAGIVAIRQLEAGVHVPRRSTLDVVQRALEAAGVEFIDENGGGASVRLRHAKTLAINCPLYWEAKPSLRAFPQGLHLVCPIAADAS